MTGLHAKQPARKKNAIVFGPAISILALALVPLVAASCEKKDELFHQPEPPQNEASNQFV